MLTILSLRFNQRGNNDSVPIGHNLSFFLASPQIVYASIPYVSLASDFASADRF
jgi:hypothetical protein